MNSFVERSSDSASAASGESGSTRMTPPFSLVLVGGFLLAPLPPVLLQPMLSLAMRALTRSHPSVFERLEGYSASVFLIDPVDLPFRFLLRPDPARPRLQIASEAEARQATAIVRGSLLALIDLLEGRVDGDALFFSRRLSVEGDTEAVVALRNAVDGEEIDIVDDVLRQIGPLAGPVRLAAGPLIGLARRAARDFATLQAALLRPALARTEAQAADLERLRRGMAETTRGRASGRAAAATTRE